jgi:NAD(P)-dependent dehydrogenase (short-subunit alcohol dehydrogenase family)
MFDLGGKTALVTGAGSGIGASIAETFARAHARVLVTDRDAAAARATADRIGESGGQATSAVLDVTDVDACRQVVASAGRLDILVNNAGIGCVGTLLETDGADLDRLYGVNVRGVFNMSKACLPAMIERRSGVLINMASVGGLVAVKDRLAYCTTKFAVVGLTKSMALDHSASGVRVNCICPARVETPWVAARVKEYPDPEKAYREMAATQVVGRMGRPDEIAAAALYLASDEAAFVTGSALVIDGCWTG